MSTASALAAFPVISEEITSGKYASLIVPEEILVALRDVKDAPEPLNDVAVSTPTMC